MTWRDGRYHLFFQLVPGRTTWAPGCHWGHATSADLVHWTEQPVALAPGDGDDGVWSGSIAETPDGALLLYTSVTTPAVGRGRIRSAAPLDHDWLRWEKGPVVADPAADSGAIHCRDPFVFRDGGTWRMLVGAALPDGSGAALSYSSDDSASWAYDGIAASRPGVEREPAWTGALWECPQLVRLDGADLLLVSVWDDDVLHGVAAAVGCWEDGRFAAATSQSLTTGPGAYAASVFRDADRRPAVVLWVRGVRGPGWAGAISLPYLLGVQDGRVSLAPHPAVDEAFPERLWLEAGEAGVDGRADLRTAPHPDLRLVLASRDGSPVAVLTIDGGELVVRLADRAERMALSPDAGIRAVVDGPVLEVSTGPALLAAAVQPVAIVRLDGGPGVEVAVPATDRRRPLRSVSRSLPAGGRPS